MKKEEYKEFIPRDAEKYNYAKSLYMQQVPQKEIAERIGVSAVTINKWKERGLWDTKRASNAISRDTLIAKTMRRMNDLLDEDEFKADAFAKAAKQLKDLHKGASVDDIIEVLSAFGEYVIRIAPTKKGVTTDWVQLLTSLQDEYIQAKLRELQQ